MLELAADFFRIDNTNGFMGCAMSIWNLEEINMQVCFFLCFPSGTEGGHNTDNGCLMQ